MKDLPWPGAHPLEHEELALKTQPRADGYSSRGDETRRSEAYYSTRVETVDGRSASYSVRRRKQVAYGFQQGICRG